MKGQEKIQKSTPPCSSLEAIGARIETLAARLGGKRDLANSSGIHETQLYKYIKGSNTPSLAVAAALAAAGKVSLDWLILGVEPISKNVDDNDYVYIPLYHPHCRQGHGAWGDRCDVLARVAFTRRALREKGLNSATLSALLNDGDSMAGLIETGDTVLIDESRNSLEGEGIYVILMNGQLCAKRLQRQFDGTIHIINENKAYRDMVIPKLHFDELEIVGRAVWLGNWLI